MTAYDPFSYGQVSLGGSKAPPAGSPDDILFADAGPAPKKAPAADSSWELLDADVTSLLPNASATSGTAAAMEFGSEILGEELGAAPMPATPPSARPRSAPVPERKAPARGKTPGVPPGQPVSTPARRTVGAAAAPMSVLDSAPVDAAPRRPAAPVSRPAGPLGRRQPRLAATLVPTTLFACGGTGAAWFYGMEQNVVMAGMVAAVSFVAAAFLWVWLRG